MSYFCSIINSLNYQLQKHGTHLFLCSRPGSHQRTNHFRLPGRRQIRVERGYPLSQSYNRGLRSLLLGHLCPLPRNHQRTQTIAKDNIPIRSIGIDTWGVDFALIGKDGELLRNPYCYRDPHTVGAPEEYFTHIPREKSI